MGVAITPLLVKDTFSKESLAGKVLVVDAFNILYQFLTTIRGPDGTPLQDEQGRVTSHLVGLYSRTTALLERGARLIFIFDGEKPVLKTVEVARRQERKAEAMAQYAAAVDAQDTSAMKKYAARTVSLTPEIIAEAKALLAALGVPCVQAPSEGEAQAARYVREGAAYAVVSQDADCLLFGATRMIRNLSISGKRKKAGSALPVVVEPELIDLPKNLAALGLRQEQLLYLAMLVGTDFNPGGIKGIGPKKALKLVLTHENPQELFDAAAWTEHQSIPWQEIYEVLSNMRTDPPVQVSWGGVNRAQVEALLVPRGFAPERFAALDKLKGRQQGLGEFFG